MYQNLTKEYLWSGFITFVTAFAVAVAPIAGGVDLSKAAILAMIAVGARAGFAAIINLVATGFKTISSK